MAKNEILLETGTNEMELLTVDVDGQLFGINVAKVQAIQQFDRQLLTGLPTAPPGVMGMYLYRETTIPLIDLAAILGKGQPEGLDREIVVITEFNNFVSSFKAHGVRNISRLSWEEFVPLSSMLGSNAYVTGTVNLEQTEIMVLDLEHILAMLFPDMIIEPLSEDSLQKKEGFKREDLQIVFAEDSSTIRKGVVSVLHKAGFQNVTEFENGLEAHEYLTQTQGSDQKADGSVVLITDIEMPRMDGLTLCKKIKQSDPLEQLPVIIFSSLINEQMIDKCKGVGADHYVTKPEVNKLMHYLDELC